MQVVETNSVLWQALVKSRRLILLREEACRAASPIERFCIHLQLRSTDMIVEAGHVIEFQAAAEDIARTSHAHPTLTEAVRQAAMAVGGWTMQM